MIIAFHRNEMKRTITAVFLAALFMAAAGQSVESPNYGLKSPLTAEIVRVD
jgi:hypothetical protein